MKNGHFWPFFTIKLLAIGTFLTKKNHFFDVRTPKNHKKCQKRDMPGGSTPISLISFFTHITQTIVEKVEKIYDDKKSAKSPKKGGFY